MGDTLARMSPHAHLKLELNDPQDPEGGMFLFLIDSAGEGTGGPVLANSFGAEMENFLWLVRSFAQFHSLDIHNETGLQLTLPAKPPVQEDNQQAMYDPSYDDAIERAEARERRI